MPIHRCADAKGKHIAVVAMFTNQVVGFLFHGDKAIGHDHHAAGHLGHAGHRQGLAQGGQQLRAPAAAKALHHRQRTLHILGRSDQGLGR